MIPLDDFRQFIRFVHQKFLPLAERYQEVNAIAIEIIERAKQIERKSVDRDWLDTNDEEKTVPSAEQDQTQDTEEVVPMSSEEPRRESDTKDEQKVQKRRKRVRQKINPKVIK